MKKTLTLISLMIASIAFNSALSQDATPLYAGHVSWSGSGNQLDEIDTTGGGFVIVSTVTLTSDFGAVDGVYGLATDPITNQMYVLYQTDIASNRRLGTLNPEAGIITDIGLCGNLVDIAFDSDGTLYGTTGSYASDFSLLLVDKVTASTSFILDHISSFYGGTIAYNTFTDEMLYINRNDISTINVDTYVETLGASTGHPGEANAFVVLSPTLAYVLHWGNMYTFNPETGVFNYHSSQERYHAMAFGPPSCNAMELEVTSFSVCLGGEITLDATAESGEDIIWDGGIFDDVPFTPEEVGVFTYTATTLDDTDCPLPVEIEVLSIPVVLPGAGDENFCEDESIVLSASGDADEYSWDPLDFTPGVGVHTYTLTGTNDGGCINSATIDITVHALPEITPTVDPILTCIGSDVVFTVEGAESYVWENPEIETGEPYTTDESGELVYNVTGTDMYGCVNTGSVTLEVAPEITITGVTTDEVEGGDGAIAITIDGGVPAYTVDWDNDGTGDFDDPASISGLTGGVYTVVINGSMGCSTTETFIVNSQLNIEDLALAGINLYPNPTIDIVNIESEGLFTYQVINANGQTVQIGNGVDKTAVNIQSLASGVYVFVINTQDETTAVRVIKN